MKMMIEKHICDVCGCEVTTEMRYTVAFGTFKNWNDDAETIDQINKDLCYECYKTVLGLISKTEVHDEPEVVATKQKRRRWHYDEGELLRLWAIGVTYKDIANRLNIPEYIVAKHLVRMSKEEKEAAKDKYGVHMQHIQERHNMKVTTDEYGFVHSVEEA